jgi:hypothetical protein
MALAEFMRLSLLKAAYAVVSSAAWQEIRVRFDRDDKGRAIFQSESKPQGRRQILSWEQLSGVRAASRCGQIFRMRANVKAEGKPSRVRNKRQG